MNIDELIQKHLKEVLVDDNNMIVKQRTTIIS